MTQNLTAEKNRESMRQKVQSVVSKATRGHTHGRPHKYRNPVIHTNTHTISVPDHRVQQGKPVIQDLTAENNRDSIRPSA